MTDPILDCVVDCQCHTGEGPLWHPDHEMLYWVDIPEGQLHRYDPKTDSHEECYNGRPIGGFTIEADGALLLFRDRGTVTLWSDEGTRTILTEIPDERDTRFNDVVADPKGRVFAGTMPTEDHLGRLYRFDMDGTHTVVDNELNLPNGMGFTPDRTAMYLSVSDEHTVYRYDYHEPTGALSNRTTFLKLDGPEVPDGLTIDAAGWVWLAWWNGGRIERYSPNGNLVKTVEMPVERPSSMAFGGPNCEDLYVSSARGEGVEEYGDLAGALFRADPETTGRLEFRSRVAIEE